MKYFVNTYGCQMNIHESEKFAGIVEKLGYTPCNEPAEADLIGFNTCCIRGTAEQKIYGHLGQCKKLKRIKPSLIIVVFGCMSQQSGVAELIKKKYPFVDIVIGTTVLGRLEELIVQAQKGKKSVDVNFYNQTEDYLPVTRTSFPNAWVNIIYGCNNFCSYCIVPYVRGRERSRNIDEVVSEVKWLVEDGYKEITLLGQNVNSYGNDLNDGTNFAELLNRIGAIEGKFRLRFMSSHPKDLTNDVIDAVAKYPNICNNIHLPVQSGSDSVLGRMNRRYTRQRYLEIVKNIKDRIPNVGITTDIMIGFPGETDQEFEETLDLVREVEFGSAFCFVYSRRNGTVADKMENQISDEVKQERITKLIATQNEVTKKISQQMIGKIYEVLIEDVNSKKVGFCCGRTESGRLVNFECAPERIGEFVNVKITSARSATLWGEITLEDKDA